MAIEAIGTEVTLSKSEKSGVSLAADLDSFLLLLTTQLQHQDPLAPLDPTEFTGQLVAFAGVEQQIQTNQHLETLLEAQNASLAAAVVGFIGTIVEADIAQLPLHDGKAEFTYELSNTANNVIITITDSEGRIVVNRGGERTGGVHEFIWDGKDENGIQQPDGAYNFSVTPLAIEGQLVTKTVTVKAHISGVAINNGVTTLEANGVMIPLDKVLTIREEPTSPVN